MPIGIGIALWPNDGRGIGANTAANSAAIAETSATPFVDAATLGVGDEAIIAETVATPFVDAASCGVALASPLDLTGCVMWVRGDQVTFDGSNKVTSWADQSPSALALTPVGGSEPTYVAARASLGNQPAVLFTGSKYLTNTLAVAVFPAGSDYTHFIVADISGTGGCFLWTGSNGAGQPNILGTNGATSKLGYEDGSFAWRDIADPVTGAQMLTWSLKNGTGGEVWRSTTSLGTGAYTTRHTLNPRLGSDSGANSVWMAEHIMYNRALSAAEIAQVQKMLSVNRSYGL